MENLETVNLINELRTEIKLIQQALERVVKAVEEDRISQRLAVLEDRDTNNSSKLNYLENEVDKFKWKLISAYGAVLLSIGAFLFAILKG